MPFLPQEVIARKRDGQDLNAGEIGAFIAGLTDGSVSHAQAAALHSAQHRMSVGHVHGGSFVAHVDDADAARLTPRALIELQPHTDARAALQRAIELDDKDPVPHLLLAQIHTDLFEADAAVQAVVQRVENLLAEQKTS